MQSGIHKNTYVDTTDAKMICLEVCFRCFSEYWPLIGTAIIILYEY